MVSVFCVEGVEAITGVGDTKMEITNPKISSLANFFTGSSLSPIIATLIGFNVRGIHVVLPI